MNGAIHSDSGPRGGPLDAAWPRIPVAHLAHETDTSFTTIHCSIPYVPFPNGRLTRCGA